MSFQIKRVYEPASPEDGLRVLVDRIWPRGVKKEQAELAAWMKDVAPSSALRTWFGHSPERFAEFARRYRDELADNPALAELRKLGQRKRVTLVYSARDEKMNQAVVLKTVLAEKPVH
jgi:uncharacterized protein YeaO (DUF488 family)